MSDRRPPRETWNDPPDTPGSVEEEVSKSPGAAAYDDPAATIHPDSSEESGYAPRHRAPGRAPLIRRRRIKPDDPEDVEVTWETSRRNQGEGEEKRWIEQEDSIVAPRARPLEESSDLGPHRSESKPRTSDEEASQELIRRSRDYSRRHLAPNKDAPTSRAAEGDVDEFADRSEVEGVRPRDETAPRPREETAARPHKTFVEGDVRDEPESGLFARPWRSRRTAAEPTRAEQTSRHEPVEPEILTETSGSPEQTASGTVAPVAAPVPPLPERSPPQREAIFPHTEPAGRGVPSEPAEVAGEHGAEEDVALGRRSAALRERKKRKKLRHTAGGVLAILGAVVAAAVVGIFAKQVVEEPRGSVAVPFEQPAAEPEDGTTLLFGTREDAGAARGAIWMTLFAYDAEKEKASIVYIPPHTAVEVPGRGLQGVGEAYGSGGIPLLLVATENLLGVSIDRYVELSDNDAFVFFEALESLTVDVPAEVRVPAGRDQARLIFVDGPQELTPELLVRLLYIVGIDGDDIELGSRHLAFWDALFDSYEDPDEVAELIEGAGAAFGESDAPVEDHAAFFGSVAALAPERVTITALPVRPISAGDSQLYATDEEELAEFVAATIGAGRDRPAEIRVQVLNGNGVPGIGQEVASRLVGEGFRVILSGNARRLNYRETLVIAYDSSDEGIALAERARELLGVGEVQVSAQQQGIVDLTIVVGKDFLRAR